MEIGAVLGCFVVCLSCGAASCSCRIVIVCREISAILVAVAGVFGNMNVELFECVDHVPFGRSISLIVLQGWMIILVVGQKNGEYVVRT